MTRYRRLGGLDKCIFPYCSGCQSPGRGWEQHLSVQSEHSSYLPWDPPRTSFNLNTSDLIPKHWSPRRPASQLQLCLKSRVGANFPSLEKLAPPTGKVSLWCSSICLGRCEKVPRTKVHILVPRSCKYGFKKKKISKVRSKTLIICMAQT